MNRVEYEDGPGSLQNIVSDPFSCVCRTWKDKPENFGERLIKRGLRGLPHDSSDGWIEYSHKLERRHNDGVEWEFVGFVNPLDDDDECEWI